ncbi:MAG TPA: hypothetical protein DCS21_12315 [Gammaproteobacteria bacterium]|nr:hypothetical protein [Gammaproteobacteria bacterium]
MWQLDAFLRDNHASFLIHCDHLMKTENQPPSDKPESKALYIPGPLVASIKTLIDAYRDRNTTTLSAALQQLEQAIMNAQPRARKSRKISAPPKLPKKAIAKAGADTWTAGGEAPKPAKKGRKGTAPYVPTSAPVSSEEAGSIIDLVACLNRDYPAIAERYAMGEFRTVKEAAIAAGIKIGS